MMSALSHGPANTPAPPCRGPSPAASAPAGLRHHPSTPFTSAASPSAHASAVPRGGAVSAPSPQGATAAAPLTAAASTASSSPHVDISGDLRDLRLQLSAQLASSCRRGAPAQAAAAAAAASAAAAVPTTPNPTPIPTTATAASIVTTTTTTTAVPAAAATTTAQASAPVPPPADPTEDTAASPSSPRFLTGPGPVPLDELHIPALAGADAVAAALQRSAEKLAGSGDRVAATSEQLRAMLHDGVAEVERTRTLLQLQEAHAARIRAALDLRLADDIEKLNTELRREEDLHAKRVSDLCKRATEVARERESHQTAAGADHLSLATHYQVQQQQQQALVVRRAFASSASPSEEGPPSPLALPRVDPMLHDRLESFYQAHNPAKLPTVLNTLLQYQGREADLFATLVGKYGPEPPVLVRPLFLFLL